MTVLRSQQKIYAQLQNGLVEMLVHLYRCCNLLSHVHSPSGIKFREFVVLVLYQVVFVFDIIVKNMHQVMSQSKSKLVLSQIHDWKKKSI